MAKNIQISELDFANIKSNIKQYMKSDPTFADYDFEGSGLSTLTDILSYNTYYNSFYLNMISNEMFLDTARLRDNVVAKAKMLGYTPTSNKSSTCNITCTFEIISDSPDNAKYNDITIDRNYVFSKRNSQTNDEYKFTPTITRVVNRAYPPVAQANNKWKHVYEIFDLELIQGIAVTENYYVDLADPNQKFILSNVNVDTSTIRVFVIPNVESSITAEYKVNTDTMSLNSLSETFFLQESYDGRYEIIFGDGVLGKSVDSGNIVTIDYLTTFGAEANGMTGDMRLISTKDNVRASSLLQNLSVIGTTGGGADKESIDSIKFYAPRTFEGQNRAVTARDYMTIIPKIYPQASSINVWGGEDNVPAQYGTVFLSIKPNSGYYLSLQDKNFIRAKLISDYSVLTLRPEIVDPDFIKLKINTQVKFDNESTLLSSANLLSSVKNTITDYNAKFLQDFNSYFRYSQFLAAIDQTDESITNNITTITMINEKDVILNNSANYTFNFSNAILPNSISSLGFDLTGYEGTYYADDDGLGKIRFYQFNSASVKIYTSVSSGTINYGTGEIVIPNLNISSIIGNNVFGITATPQSMDIFPVRNQIIDIDLSELSITMLEDTDEFNENYNISTQRVVVSRNISTSYNESVSRVTSGTRTASITRVYADGPSSGSSSGATSSSSGSSGGTTSSSSGYSGGSSSSGSSSSGSSSGGGY
jgi:hypothetical protein